MRTVLAGLLLSTVFVAGLASATSVGARSREAGVGAALPAPMTLAGVGGVAPGMTAAQVPRAWGVPVVPTGKGPCKMARIATGRVRGYALFLKGRLGAVFFTAGIKSDRGIGVGSTYDEVRAAYGESVFFWPAPDSRTGLHVYSKPRYLGDGRALRFDIDPGKTALVTQIGIGGPALRFSTGRC